MCSRYRKVARSFSDTFVADIPGVSTVHRSILAASRGISALLDLPWALTDGEMWLSYDGAELYADTSDHVAGTIRREGAYEPEIRDALRQHLQPGDLAIDAGAHIGHHGVTMRQCVGESGEVLLFEPNPDNADYIRRTIAANGWDNVTLYEVALSDAEASETLVVASEDSTAGSFLQERNTTDPSGCGDRSTEYTVTTRQLSSVIAEEGLDHIDLMKVDVEGAETEIIDDIGADLGLVSTILLEFHTHKIPAPDIERVYDLLSEHGVVRSLDGEPLSLETVMDSKRTIVWQSD